MLYILHRGNHPDLTYSEGQQPIVHLQADLRATVRWAEENAVPWAFSDRNAGGYLARFYSNLDDLEHIDWQAVAATDFRDPTVKEGKQAEFLLHHSFPWELLEKIGVMTPEVKHEVDRILADQGKTSVAVVEREWYY